MRRVCEWLALAAFLLWAPASAAQTKEVCVDAANSAQTLHDAGKYVASRAKLLVCSSNVCPALVGQSCRQWLSQIDADLPTVVFDVKDDRGQDRADVHVSVDGEALFDRLSGTPVPVDPGEHLVLFEARGFVPREEHVVLHVGEKNRRIDITLAPLVAQRVATPPTKHVEDEKASSPIVRNVVGIGLAALAVGSVVTGFYFVGQADGEADKATSLRRQVPSSSGCAGVSSPTCNQLGDAVDARHRDANISTAFFVAAVGLAVGAAATWLFWPSNAPPNTASSLMSGSLVW